MPGGGPGPPRAFNVAGKCLSDVEMGRCMIANGFPRDVHVIAEGIGVSTAESGRCGIPQHGGGGGGGAWQITGPHTPAACRPCNQSTTSHACMDHDANTACAAAIWSANHRSFAGQWTTYHPGIGDPFMDAARTALDQGPQKASSAGGLNLPNPLSGLDAIASVLEAIAKFFVGLGELLLTPEGWARLGKLIGGATLIALGVNRLAKLSLGVDPIGTVTSGAFAAFPVGRGVVGKIGGIGKTAQEVASG